MGTNKPTELKYRFYGRPPATQGQVQEIIRIGGFAHHLFADFAETAPVTGRRGRGRFFNEPDSLEMGRTAVTGPGDRNIDLSGTITDNPELSESPNLPPHPTTTSSSDNATQTHHDSAEQQESEGVTVPDEDIYDTGRFSPLDLDIDHEAAMMQGNSRSVSPFVMAYGMEPDEIDERVNESHSELLPSCTDDDWYHASQAIMAAAAASQLQLAAESNTDSESVTPMATAMDNYIDWPEEDSE